MASDRLGRSRELAYLAASVGLLLLAWHIGALFADPRIFPGPVPVFSYLGKLAASGELWVDLGATLARVVASFAIAMAVGSIIGVWLGMKPAADRLFGPWVVLFLNLPALVVIVLAYIWFGLSEAAAIGAVAFTKIPNVVVTLREGARALDPAYSDMAQVFRFGRWKTLRHVIGPQLQPYIAAASRSGISLIWKIVLVVELLGRSNGVGFQIYTSFQFFDVTAIIAWSLAFVVVMLAIEVLMVQPFERSSTKWRKSNA
jgi:NitT/TauT family transport system permease protein